MGIRNVKAGLRMHEEMFGAFQAVGRQWLARAASEAELAFKLPNALKNARSLPDALSAYRAWMREWLRMCGNDGLSLVSDSQKLVETAMQCCATASSAI